MATPPLHPFNYSNADVVFRSSDDVVYKLHKLVLSLASDSFSTGGMFELPQPNQSSGSSLPTKPTDGEQVDGLPVIPVSEPSSVLTPLFLLCYPLELDPDLASITQVRAVLEAAIKYDMRKAVKITRSRLRQLIPCAPLRVYAIACKLGFEDDAREAAKEVHKQQVQDKYVEELEEIPFGAYHRLLYFCTLGGGSALGQHFSSSFAAATTSGTAAMGARLIKKKPQRGAGVAPTPSSTSVPSTPTAEPPTATAPPVNQSSDSQTCFNHPPPGTAAFDDQGVVFAASDGRKVRSAGDAILRASPVLRGLAAACSSCTEGIHVQERAATMSILVRIYDLFEHVTVPDLLDIHNALAAAEKYQLQKAVAFLQASLRSWRTTAPGAPSGDALLVFAIACRFEMRDLALVAARATLRTNSTLTLAPAIDHVNASAGCLHRLLDYHRRCRAAIKPIFETRTWLQGFWLPRMQNAPCAAATSAPKTVPSAPSGLFGSLPRIPAKWACWYEPYMKAAAASALWPSSASVTREDVLYAGLCVNPAASVAGASAPPASGHCPHCMLGKGAVELFQFSQHVASTITAWENQVNLTWPTPPVQQAAPAPAASASA